MKLYRFKDRIDGREAIVLAENENVAGKLLQGETALPFRLIDRREAKIKGCKQAKIVENNILPF